MMECEQWILRPSELHRQQVVTESGSCQFDRRHLVQVGVGQISMMRKGQTWSCKVDAASGHGGDARLVSRRMHVLGEVLQSSYRYGLIPEDSLHNLGGGQERKLRALHRHVGKQVVRLTRWVFHWTNLGSNPIPHRILDETWSICIWYN